MKRVTYSLETKNKAIEMKIEGYSAKEIMNTLNIRIDKVKLGGNGTKMVNIIDFINKLENNIPTERD